MPRGLPAIAAALLLGVSAIGASTVGASAAVRTLERCTPGQIVIDGSGVRGIVVSGSPDLCLVRYANGQIIGWTLGSLSPSAGTSGATGANPPPTVITPQPQSAAPQVTIIRPSEPPHSLSVRAIGGNRFELTAAVDGTPIRFVVDTGASLVTLRMADAEAIGIRRSSLTFDHVMETASGRVRVALVMLHDISIDDLSVDGVAAAVGNVKVSVLGMNFLRRLKRFEIDGDALTLEW